MTVLGWAVAHSLWQGAFLAALTAMILTLIPDRRARTRYVVACVSLGVMVVAPLVSAISHADFLTSATRLEVTRAIDATISLPAVVQWRSLVVPAIAGAWLIGVAVCGLRIAAEWRRARALRREGLGDAGKTARAVVEDLRQRLVVLTTVIVRRSDRALVPMVLGWWRPVILLPDSTAGTLLSSQLRAVLAHELAHVRRRDYLTNACQIAAEALLFHHPGARWISRRIRTEREYCCDDVAVTMSDGAVDYARALAALDDARDDCRLAVAAASGTLLDRIQRVVGEPRPVLTPARGALVLVTASLVASILLALAMAVPPSLPLDVQLRSKSRSPVNVVPVPAGGALLQKTRQR